MSLPWSFYPDDETRFWVHIGLVGFGFVLAIITFVVQWIKPAPYGKHEGNEVKNWGPMIRQRLGHMMSDALPGVVMFVLVFFLYGHARGIVNYIFLALWLCHYIHRGIIHPLVMRYRNKHVALGITIGGGLPNILYHFLNADFIGNAAFHDNFLYDPRFIVGVLVYAVGYIINRWADFKLRSLRKPKSEDGESGYVIPHGGLFEYITCPNYFGELVEWLGWTLATWSLAGLVWTLFSAATFVPRSRHNHAWYRQRFENYPSRRKALIPCIF